LDLAIEAMTIVQAVIVTNRTRCGEIRSEFQIGVTFAGLVGAPFA
jgi:hypothetical protein